MNGQEEGKAKQTQGEQLQRESHFMKTMASLKKCFQLLLSPQGGNRWIPSLYSIPNKSPANNPIGQLTARVQGRLLAQFLQLRLPEQNTECKNRKQIRRGNQKTCAACNYVPQLPKRRGLPSPSIHLPKFSVDYSFGMKI